MTTMPKPVTRLCAHSPTQILYRGADLVEELVGKRSFTEVMFRQILGRFPTPAERDVVDAVLVIGMEHGFSPSAIAARLVYMSAPEGLQSAVAAGLLAIGSQFVGTIEDCARLLAEIMEDREDPAVTAARIVQRHRAEGRRLPGFGHHLHKPEDPRAQRLLALLSEKGIADRHVEALRHLSDAVDGVHGKHVAINATGAVAASLGEIGAPWRLMRGFAVISRAAGLVAHIGEEQTEPAGRYIWDRIDTDISYVADASCDSGSRS